MLGWSRRGLMIAKPVWPFRLGSSNWDVEMFKLGTTLKHISQYELPTSAGNPSVAQIQACVLLSPNARWVLVVWLLLVSSLDYYLLATHTLNFDLFEMALLFLCLVLLHFLFELADFLHTFAFFISSLVFVGFLSVACASGLLIRGVAWFYASLECFQNVSWRRSQLDMLRMWDGNKLAM